MSNINNDLGVNELVEVLINEESKTIEAAG
jgi:hypothetical protein